LEIGDAHDQGLGIRSRHGGRSLHIEYSRLAEGHVECDPDSTAIGASANHCATGDLRGDGSG